MTTSTVISNAAAQAMLNAFTALLNGGHIKIFTGTQPATCETADSGTLLVTLALNATAFAAATDGADGTAHASANTITSGTAGNTGTAGYFRAYDSGGSCHDQGDVGLSGTDFVITDTTITTLDVIGVTSWLLKQPDGSGSD